MPARRTAGHLCNHKRNRPNDIATIMGVAATVVGIAPPLFKARLSSISVSILRCRVERITFAEPRTSQSCLLSDKHANVASAVDPSCGPMPGLKLGGRLHLFAYR